MYLVDWGAAYLKRRRDIGEGCRSLVTPGGDSGGSPHLSTQRHTAHTNDGRSMGGEGVGGDGVWDTHHSTLGQSQGSNYSSSTNTTHQINTFFFFKYR